MEIFPIVLFLVGRGASSERLSICYYRENEKNFLVFSQNANFKFSIMARRRFEGNISSFIYHYFLVFANPLPKKTTFSIDSTFICCQLLWAAVLLEFIERNQWCFYYYEASNEKLFFSPFNST